MIRNLNAILALLFLGLSSSGASAATWTNTPLLAAQSGSIVAADPGLIPSTPTRAASAINPTQINLSWNGAVAPSGYMIQSYPVQRDRIEIARVAGNSYNNTSLVASMTYAYRVASILSNGEGSALSNVVPKTTLAAPAPTPIPMPVQSSNGAPVPDVTKFSGIDGSLINLDNHAFEVQTLQPYSLQNPDPQTLRFELRSGDAYGNYSGTERVELEQQIYVNRTWGYPADTDLHVAYDFMLEPGNPNTSQWVVIGQWHHDDSGPPPFAVALRGEYMRIITRTADTNAEVDMYTDPKPIQRGHYYAMDISVNFARGTLSVVRDGVPIVSFSGQRKLGTGNSRYYWKHGLYRAPTKNDTQVAHYRNFIISP